jgi:DNA-binding NarL/FixJ family response regulator
MTPHVLVVDDDARFAESVSAELELDGRVVVAGRAGDGREAIELAHALSPDVVLMDIHMPLMDGFDATRMIRHLLPATRVVLMTSSDLAADRHQATNVGAHIFLRKDVGHEALVEAAVGAARGAVAS